MKKLEIEKTKPNFTTPVLKVEYLVILVSSIANFFINKMSLANKWMRKKIPSFCNLALVAKSQLISEAISPKKRIHIF